VAGRPGPATCRLVRKQRGPELHVEVEVVRVDAEGLQEVWQRNFKVNL
jgi:hypothetical protein